MLIIFTVEVEGEVEEFSTWYAGQHQWETGMACDGRGLSFGSFDTLGEALDFLQHG